MEEYGLDEEMNDFACETFMQQLTSAFIFFFFMTHTQAHQCLQGAVTMTVAAGEEY